MTRGELAIAQLYNRTLYYGTAPVVIIQLPDFWSSEVAIIRSALTPKGREWRANFEELTAIPRQELTRI